MIILPDRREHNRVVRAIREANEGAAAEGEYNIGLSLTAHPDTGPYVDLSQAWTAGEWGQTETPITLDATIGAVVPKRAQDARTLLIAEVAGVPVHQLHGEKTVFLPSDDEYSTDLLTSSPGSLLNGEDAIKLNDDRNYRGTAPHNIIRDVARLLPYDQSQVFVDELPKVFLHMADHGASPGFTRYETVGDVFARLAAEQTVGYEYRDTAYKGLRAYLPLPLGLDMGGVPPNKGGYRTYHADRLPRWGLERPQPPQERYSAVRVYHLSERSHKVLWECIEEIPYPAGVRQPHRHRYLDIPFLDGTDEGPTQGRALAKREALRRARETAEGDELTLPAYDPLLEREDPLVVSETHRDMDGLFEREWAMRVDSYKHQYAESAQGQGSIETVCSYTATLLEEDQIRTPTYIGPTPQAGVVASPRESYGLDGEDLYFDEPTPWVTLDGDDLVYQPNNHLTIDGDEIVVSE